VSEQFQLFGTMNQRDQILASAGSFLAHEKTEHRYDLEGDVPPMSADAHPFSASLP
jgi:hypothetical protein